MDNEMQQTNPNWYKDLQYQDVKVYIRDNINLASRSFVAIGYYLKYVRDNELFSEDGYSSIWEFAQGEFGFSQSWASRYMSINDRFSKDGNSPILIDKYVGFDKSKLSEMLTLTDQQLEQVTIATTVAEIKDLKRSEKAYATSHREPECFIKKDLPGELMCSGGISDNCNTCDRYDSVETEPDEPKLIDDLDFTVRTYNCLKRAGIDTINELCDLTEDKVIAIRNVSRKCLDEINEKVSAIGKSLKSDITEIVSIESEYIETVTNETEENRIPDPDLSCKFDLEARCLTASKESCKRINDDRCMYSSGWDEEDYIIAELDVELDPIETVEADIIQTEPEEYFNDQCADRGLKFNNWLKANNFSIAQIVRDILCDIPLANDKDPFLSSKVTNMLISSLIIKTDAYYSYLTKELDIEPESVKSEQPELPILRNNDQRKEFIDAYETWPIWIDQELTGERYYRYDFDNSESFVIRVSLCRKYLGWDKGYSKELAYGREEYFILKKDLPFVESGASKSMMIDYLKEVQKKGG